MKDAFGRRDFITSIALAGAGLGLVGRRALPATRRHQDAIPVGIIGLDTSHAPAFARLINHPDEGAPEFSGFRVVAACPYGSRTIESSYSRIPQYTEEVQQLGVEIVDSIDELLERVEAVLLLTNDGQPRLEQSLQVLQAGKRAFLDKPVAASLADTIAIMEAAKQHDRPVFSSSSLRYMESAQAVRNKGSVGQVLGADAYSPSTIEETHPDLFWYGIHGVEILFTALGAGCESVTRTTTDTTDVVVGTWGGDRLGVFRGLRDGTSEYGGTAYGSERILPLGPYEGYEPLVVEILEFFRTGVPPVSMDETLEIYAFMEAADESKRQGGASVRLEDVVQRARQQHDQVPT